MYDRFTIAEHLSVLRRLNRYSATLPSASWNESAKASTFRHCQNRLINKTPTTIQMIPTIRQTLIGWTG